MDRQQPDQSKMYSLANLGTLYHVKKTASVTNDFDLFTIYYYLFTS